MKQLVELLFFCSTISYKNCSQNFITSYTITLVLFLFLACRLTLNLDILISTYNSQAKVYNYMLIFLKMTKCIFVLRISRRLSMLLCNNDKNITPCLKNVLHCNFAVSCTNCSFSLAECPGPEFTFIFSSA